MGDKITLTNAQRILLEIITQLESGLTTPIEATKSLNDLKLAAPVEFKANYSIGDFQRIRANARSAYQSSTSEPEPAFESSYQSSY